MNSNISLQSHLALVGSIYQNSLAPAKSLVAFAEGDEEEPDLDSFGDDDLEEEEEDDLDLSDDEEDDSY